MKKKTKIKKQSMGKKLLKNRCKPKLASKPNDSRGMSKKQRDIVEKAMHKYYHGKLRSASTGEIVTDWDEAIAIALSEAGLSRKQIGQLKKNPLIDAIVQGAGIAIGSGMVVAASSYIKKNKNPKNKAEVIIYSPSYDIRNLDSLPRGLNARYLEVIKSHKPGVYIAKQWRRKISGLSGIFFDLKPSKDRIKNKNPKSFPEVIKELRATLNRAKNAITIKALNDQIYYAEGLMESLTRSEKNSSKMNEIHEELTALWNYYVLNYKRKGRIKVILKKNPRLKGATNSAKWYIGIIKTNPKYAEIFSASSSPTKTKYGGKYINVVGPYKTRQAARAGLKPLKLQLRPLRSNPVSARQSRGGVIIYDDILAIEAVKGRNSLWPGEEFRHDFKRTKGKAQVIGLPDGSLHIKPTGKNPKKLWRVFSYD